MVVPAAVRPHRGLVFPFFVAGFPMIWFVLRETPVRVVDGQRVATPLPRTLALSIAAVLASYTIAVAVVAAVGPRDEAAAWQRVLFRPTDRALHTLVLLCSAVVAFAALHSTAALPYWSELVVGVPLLWPLLIAMLVTIVAGNAVPALQSFTLQTSMAVLGLGLSAAWMFLLSSGIARALAPAE